MKTALEILGIPTWHWVSMVENPRDMTMWCEALRTKYHTISTSSASSASSSETPPTAPVSVPAFLDKPFFDSLLSKWAAVTDQPACFFASDLQHAYPSARVVLVERDIESWYKSYSATVIAGAANPFIPLLCWFDDLYIGNMARIIDILGSNVFGAKESRVRYAIFNNPAFFDEWRGKAREVYRAHYAHVEAVTPPERLLLFRLKEVWEPLCEFLGKEVPDVPFPRVNETTAVQEKIEIYIREGCRRGAVKTAKRFGPPMLTVMAAVVVWRLLRHL